MQESNPRHLVYKTSALPTELTRHNLAPWHGRPPGAPPGLPCCPLHNTPGRPCHDRRWRGARFPPAARAFIDGAYLDAAAGATFDCVSPVGGYKQSGFGRDKSLYAMEKCTELKSTWIQLR